MATWTTNLPFQRAFYGHPTMGGSTMPNQAWPQNGFVFPESTTTGQNLFDVPRLTNAQENEGNLGGFRHDTQAALAELDALFGGGRRDVGSAVNWTAFSNHIVNRTTPPLSQTCRSADSLLGSHGPLHLLNSSDNYTPSGQTSQGANAALHHAGIQDPASSDIMSGQALSRANTPAASSFAGCQVATTVPQPSQLVQRTQRPRVHRQPFQRRHVSPTAGTRLLIVCHICWSSHRGLEEFAKHIKTNHLSDTKTGKTKKNREERCPCPWPNCDEEPSCADVMRHVQEHAGVVLKCTHQGCNKQAWRIDTIRDHIKKTHDGNLDSWDEIWAQ